jgi:hypothetical protein
MAGRTRAYWPAMSDAVVTAKTGRTWAGWLAALDKANAARLPHAAIAEILSGRYGVPRWWCQMVAVEYERARGLRVRHETAGGFAVAISKTIATSLSTLYAATANGAVHRHGSPAARSKRRHAPRTNMFAGPGRRARGSTSGFTRRARTKRRSPCR